MAKVTIDEVEYESDDFTEEQKKLLNEITYNNNIQKQLDYQMYTLKHINDSLVATLKGQLKEVKDKAA
jgi:hypothetical protein